nr:ATPase subunit 9 [Cistanche deserticola]
MGLDRAFSRGHLQLLNGACRTEPVLSYCPKFDYTTRGRWLKAAVGIGNVFSSLIHSVARNPSLAKQLFGYAILGFALTEAIALFALMMAFLISFVF